MTIIDDLFDSGQVGVAYDATDPSTLWTDAGKTTNVSVDGDLVYVIEDISGNGLDLIQPTSGLRAIYRTGGGTHWIEMPLAAYYELGTTNLLRNIGSMLQGMKVNAATVNPAATISTLWQVGTPAFAQRSGAFSFSGAVRTGGRRLDGDSFIPAIVDDYNDGGSYIDHADYTNSDKTVYFNNVVELNDPAFQTDGNTSDTASGGFHLGGKFGADLSEFNLYRFALVGDTSHTASDIEALHEWLIDDGIIPDTSILSYSNPNLTAAYPFEGDISTTIPDASGNGITGTPNGTAVQTPDGHILKAIEFDGTSTSNGDFGASTDWDYIHKTGEFGISMWYRNEDLVPASYIATNYGTHVANYGFRIQQTGTVGTITCHIARANASLLATIIGTTVISDNEWHHLVLTGDGVGMTLYVDNIWNGYTAYAFALPTGNAIYPMRIGNGNGAANAPLEGGADEFRSLNTYITPQQVKALYQETVSLFSSKLYVGISIGV